MPNEKQALHSNEANRWPYSRAAQFKGEADSREAYLAAERGIAAVAADISVFRLQLRSVWHVAAVAEVAPDSALQQVIEESLREGARVGLPIEALTVLLNRHRQVMRHRLPWLEAHYHPGRRFPLE